MEITTWRALLDDPPAEAEWDFVSFRNPPLASEDLVVLTREAEWGLDDDYVPSAALEYEITDSIECATVREVMDNATSQLGTASPDDLLAAMDYYCQYDAFLSFESR